MNAQRIQVSPALTIMTHPSFVMLIWHNGPTLESVQGLERVLAEYVERGEPIDLVAVILPVTDYPDDEARRRLAEAMRAPVLQKFAIVNEGKGFRASIVRSIISGITLLTRHSGPTKVFASMEDAGAWLTNEPRTYGVPELQSVYANAGVQAESRVAT